MIALLKKADMVTVQNRFWAEKFALNLGERDSTATITVGPEAPDITIGDALKDEDEPGAGIVWIVNKVDTDYITNTRTISCNHAISLLKNYILFGEQTTATIANKTGAKTVSARDAMKYVLSFQRDFLLDKFATGYNSVTGAYTFNGDAVFDAMETISKTLEDCWWDYDFSTYPFKLNIRDRRNAPVETELRLNRNMQSVKLTIDKSSMYTRIFPIGANDLQLPEKYIADATAEKTFGMISKTQTESSKSTEAALREWAKNELKYHHEPAVTVSVSAQDLYHLTKENLDFVKLGAVCRVALPDYKTVIQERVTKLAYADKIKDPDSFTVTLANTRETASQVVASSIKSSSKSSRQASSNVSKGVLDIDLRQSGNNWTLWREDYKGVWKDVGTFNRAVTSWSVSATGGTITVTAKPQNQSKGVQVRGGTATQSGKTVSGPIQWYDDSAKTWKDTGKKYSATVTIDEEAIKRKVTLANPKWLYDPDPDINKTTNTVTVKTLGRNPNLEQTVKLYIIDGAWGTPATGKKYVYITHTNTQAQRRVARMTIDATLKNPVWRYEPSSTITGNSNTVTVKSATGEEKPTTIYMSRGNWGAGSLTQGQRYIYVHDGNTTAATRVARISVDATMSGPSWTTNPSSSISGNSNKATITSLTGQSIEVPIYMTRGDWAAGTLPAGERYIYVNYSDTTAANRIARLLVDARMSDPSWTYGPSSAVTGGYNKVTVSSMTGESKEINLYMNDDEWSSGTKYVYVTQTDSTEDNRVMRTTVTMQNPKNMSSITRYQRYAPTGGYSYGNLSKSGLEVGYYYYMTVNICNKTVTFYFYVQN